MNVTNHAIRRIKERIGLPKRTALRTAKKAFETGLKYEDTKGPIRIYFEYLYKKTFKTPNIRVHGDFVYLFSMDDALITVFRLPTEHKKTVRKLLAEREKGTA